VTTSYGQYCPIAKATELLGERWTMLVLRELLIGSRQFNAIARGVPTMSRNLLTKRLRQLERAGLVERVDGAYELTMAGRSLRPIVFGVGDWAATWILTDPEPAELDPTLLLWWAHGRLNTSALPERRVVIEFAFVDDRRRYWMVIEPVGCSLCDTDPGFGVDATITTDVMTLHRVLNGREALSVARREDRMTFSGTTAITRRLPDMLRLTTLAELAQRPA
jgi:DNA-binding HxlR family transcriptional regulator